MKRLLAGILLTVFLCGVLPVAAETIPCYTIDREYNEIDSPPAFTPVSKITAGKAGAPIGEIADMEASGDHLFLLTIAGDILIYDNSFQLEKVISGFDNDGAQDAFKEPRGLTLAPDGDLYIADTENNRIVRLTTDGELVRIYGRPEISVIDEDYVYKPLKVGVDRAQRIYVIAQGVNRGLVELDVDGNFTGFFGAPKVLYDPLQILWKRLLSQVASDKLEKFVPTEFSNLTIDQEGFIFTTIRANDITKMYKAVRAHDQESVKAVMRLNAGGIDILKRYGDVPIVGDVNFEIPPDSDGSGASKETHATYNPSAFVDIAVEASGTYYCLDAMRGRVFTYDIDGNMLYAFGEKGSKLGNLENPVALGLMDDYLLVADNGDTSVTIFQKTDYGQMIEQASLLFYEGHYDQSLETWQDVNKYNANLTIAYIGMGKCYYRLDEYKQAYDCLTIAKEKYYSSKAFDKYRHELMIRYGTPIFTVGIIVVAGIVVFAVYRFIRGRKEVDE